jgi:hypothetical protein
MRPVCAPAAHASKKIPAIAAGQVSAPKTWATFSCRDHAHDRRAGTTMFVRLVKMESPSRSRGTGGRGFHLRDDYATKHSRNAPSRLPSVSATTQVATPRTRRALAYRSADLGAGAQACLLVIAFAPSVSFARARPLGRRHSCSLGVANGQYLFNRRRRRCINGLEDCLDRGSIDRPVDIHA